MWTATTRARHNRDRLRFASDLTDAEWAVLERHLPPAAVIGRPLLVPHEIRVGLLEADCLT